MCPGNCLKVEWSMLAPWSIFWALKTQLVEIRIGGVGSPELSWCSHDRSRAWLWAVHGSQLTLIVPTVVRLQHRCAMRVKPNNSQQTFTYIYDSFVVGTSMTLLGLPFWMPRFSEVRCMDKRPWSECTLQLRYWDIETEGPETLRGYPCAEDSHFHLGQSYVLPGNFHYFDAGGRPLHADLRIRRVHGLLLQSYTPMIVSEHMVPPKSNGIQWFIIIFMNIFPIKLAIFLGGTPFSDTQTCGHRLYCDVWLLLRATSMFLGCVGLSDICPPLDHLISPVFAVYRFISTIC